jgi:hypothetical protein
MGRTQDGKDTGWEGHRMGRMGRTQDGGCLTARQELSRQRVGLASPDNSDTHDSNGGRGRCCRCGRRGRHGRRGSGGGATSYTSAASVEDREPVELQAT